MRSVREMGVVHLVSQWTRLGYSASQRAVAMTLFVCREQMESQLEKEARFRQLMAHSSHDSAIDTDSMEWETEVVEFERETVNCPQVFFSPALLNTQAWDGSERGPALSQCPLASWLLVGRSAFPPGAQMHPLPALVRAR